MARMLWTILFLALCGSNAFAQFEGGGVHPGGASADVQINNGGILAGGPIPAGTVEPIFRFSGAATALVGFSSVAAQVMELDFQDGGTSKWQIGKLWNNHWILTDQTNAGATAYDVNTVGDTTIGETNKFQIPAGTALPVVSACGTTPSITATSNSLSGTFTMGTGTPTTCTITINRAFTNQWICSLSPAGATAYAGTWRISAQSTTAFTLTLGTGTSSLVWQYVCSGY